MGNLLLQLRKESVTTEQGPGMWAGYPQRVPRGSVEPTTALMLRVRERSGEAGRQTRGQTRPSSE